MNNENMNISTIGMTLSEYQKYICDIILRIQKEKRVEIVIKKDSLNRPKYVLEFTPPEWFTELSEDIQKCAYDNLQRILYDRVKNGVNKFLDEVENEGELCN